jgi:hypothetical protein
MIYLKYALLVPFELFFTLIALILSPILPLFSSNTYGYIDNGSATGFGPRLPKWLNWFQTWDNSLFGDAGFQAINGTSYLSMIKWLIRNPLPCFAEKILLNANCLIEGNNNVTDGNQGVEGSVLVTSNGLFQYVWIKKIPFNRCIYINLGWNLRALTRGASVPYHATFSFSPRISGFQ